MTSRRRKPPMRTLLATLIFVPALALAQVPLDPDTNPDATEAPSAPPTRPTRPLPFARPGGAGQPGRPARMLTPRGTAPTGATDAAPTAPPRGVRAPATGRPGAPGAATPPPAAGSEEATIKRADGRCVPLTGRFMLSFNKADIVDVLEQASRWTCRNFIYTEDVARGKITLLSKTAVTAEEAYAAFLAALAANNITLYPTGKYYKLGRSPDSKKLPIPTYTDSSSGTPASEQIITKVIRLQSSDADQLRGVLGNFISPQGADIQSIPPDTLIITDTGLNIRRIERMLETIDRSGAGDVIRLVPLRYAAAKDIADKLNQIFQAQGAGKAGRRGIAVSPGAPGRPTPGAVVPPGQPQVTPASPGAPGGAVDVSVSKVLPDERTNKLIVIADEKSFARIQELVNQLDVPTGADGGIHVVFLKNASAEDLATTLSNLAQGQSKRTGPAGGAPGGAQPQNPSFPNRPPQAAATPESVTAELLSGDVEITADKQQNALLVQASGSDFAAIARLIDKLDRPRRQVFVEAVIMEVNLSNQNDFGVAAHGFVDVDVNGKKGVLPLISQPGTMSSLSASSLVSLGGFLTGFTGPTSGVLKELTGLSLPSIGLVVRALQSSSDVNVISTPHVVATDNEDSEITVGQNVPFQTGFLSSNVTNLLNSATGSNSAASNLSNLTTGIQRQNVELRLKMKPQINEGGNVRLTVEVQNEEIASNDATLGPTTSKRSVKTQIITHDQSTIVIGGLIQERTTRSVKKVPVLGSLPILGYLFRDQSTIKQKTNLLVFLTPYIIRDEADYRRIFEKKRQEQEEFFLQFYGRRRDFKVDVDFARKAGPLTHLHQVVVEETTKLENGGKGLPGEGLSTPPAEPPAAPLTPAPLPHDVAPAPEPPRPPSPANPDTLEPQPDFPAPDGEPPSPNGAE